MVKTEMAGIFFITGIDTDIGKSVATGLICRYLSQQGQCVISQKIVQTGCRGIAEDIITHRQLMGVDLLKEDLSGETCPYVLAKPCSPHLAAELEGTVIDPERIRQTSHRLAKKYDTLVIEGAGGLLVPLTADYTTLDYIEEQRHPLIVVSSSRLGSINHTLSLLELAEKRGLEILGIVYNRHQEHDSVIGDDSRRVFQRYLARYGFPSCVVDIPSFDDVSHPLQVDFGPLFDNCS